MVKRFVAYILFGVAGLESVTLPLTLVRLLPLYGQTGMPSNVVRMAIMSTIIVTLTIALIIFCVGVYILIKTRKNIDTIKKSKTQIEDRSAGEQESIPLE